jgi:hypothetical protein
MKLQWSEIDRGIEIKWNEEYELGKRKKQYNTMFVLHTVHFLLGHFRINKINAATYISRHCGSKIYPQICGLVFFDLDLCDKSHHSTFSVHGLRAVSQHWFSQKQKNILLARLLAFL